MDQRARIIAALDIVIEKLPIPEWNEVVFVKAMNGLEREAFDDVIYRKKTHLLATLAQATIVDESGRASSRLKISRRSRPRAPMRSSGSGIGTRRTAASGRRRWRSRKKT
jgi:cytochrome c-type biogenesis protein CcmH/NrfG